MNGNEVEAVFENHRFILDWNKITESDDIVRYTPKTPIGYYNEYMFDWEWCTVKEVVSINVPAYQKLGYEAPDRGFLASMLLPDPGQQKAEGLSFVVEVEK